MGACCGKGRIRLVKYRFVINERKPGQGRDALREFQLIGRTLREQPSALASLLVSGPLAASPPVVLGLPFYACVRAAGWAVVPRLRGCTGEWRDWACNRSV
jgi:hypothetical protein